MFPEDEFPLELYSNSYNEVAHEAGPKNPSRRPPLSQVLADYLPLPREALFLGVAADQLPVLVNVLNPDPGPILIAGDEGSMKTNLLQVIARGVDNTSNPKDIQYGVITAHPEEWDGLGGTQNCVGIFSAYKNDAQDLLTSLASWAHSNRGNKQTMVLLVDDLTTISKMDFDARQNMRWLLLRGPARHVWPIVTVNPKRLMEVHPWLDFFHTRLFGRMEKSSEAQQLTKSTQRFDNIDADSDFLMREGSNWLKFWIPSVE